ncbi:jg22174 [Pararge aegeria aegeria]|uniref:Jg22174 protein n=1 Tax=Pararge aegeria aegeria TaxID=348720 RepID=A0A8S4QVA4_9NEOP|nr:jg22174 [Pararge aegeria aegeria]
MLRHLYPIENKTSITEEGDTAHNVFCLQHAGPSRQAEQEYDKSKDQNDPEPFCCNDEIQSEHRRINLRTRFHRNVGTFTRSTESRRRRKNRAVMLYRRLVCEAGRDRQCRGAEPLKYHSAGVLRLRNTGTGH